jgi:hypothetical protein
MPHLVHGKFALARLTAEGVKNLARLRKVYIRADGQYLLKSSPPGDDSGYSAITLRQVGKGTAIYIAGQVFRGFETHGQWCLKPIIGNLLNRAMGQPFVRLESPVWLELCLMRQGQRILVHLVNYHGNRAFDHNNQCAEQVFPVQNAVVYLVMEKRPAQVTLEPGGVVLHWIHEEGLLHVYVPEVRVHCAVVVEPA